MEREGRGKRNKQRLKDTRKELLMQLLNQETVGKKGQRLLQKLSSGKMCGHTIITMTEPGGGKWFRLQDILTANNSTVPMSEVLADLFKDEVMFVGAEKTVFLKDSGLYHTLLLIDGPAAKELQDYVFGMMLPEFIVKGRIV